MPETLDVTTRREGLVAILETDGYISDPAAERVAEAGGVVIDDGIKHIVLNLEKSRIANSMGISILIELIERVRELDGKVAFCCVTPILAKTFQIMGLLKVADLYDTESEAVQALNELAG